jgi:hypothetical protein
MTPEPKPRGTFWYPIHSDFHVGDTPGYIQRALIAHICLAPDLPAAVLERVRSRVHQEKSNA